MTEKNFLIKSLPQAHRIIKEMNFSPGRDSDHRSSVCAVPARIPDGAVSAFRRRPRSPFYRLVIRDGVVLERRTGTGRGLYTEITTIRKPNRLNPPVTATDRCLRGTRETRKRSASDSPVLSIHSSVP